LTNLIWVLRTWFADDPQVYVSGNNLMYYVPGDKNRHVAPDVFVVKGIPKNKQRDYYLVWEEGRAPQLIIEITSPSTKKEDLETKYRLYRDTLRVQEYFLFDPYGEYLRPKLQGYRLQRRQYVRIKQVAGRLPSEVLALEFEAAGDDLRVLNPATNAWLQTPEEALTTKDEALAAKDEALAAKDDEIARLRGQLDSLRRGDAH
jgi:Uma2 family endonuclease